MPDIYDDPELQDDESIAPQARFTRIGDNVRGRILTIEKIQTKFGPCLKYMLFTDSGQEISLLAGSVNLKGQVMALKPRVGDVLDVELIEFRNSANGQTKIYDVGVEEGDRQALAPTPRRAAAPVTQIAPESGSQPLAPAPRPVQNGRPGREPITQMAPDTADDEGDIFNR